MILSGVQKFTILDFPEKVSCIAFIPGCDFRCGYCHNPEFVLPEKLKEISGSFIKEKFFFNFLRRRRGFLDGVVISGGEPTLAFDLEPFIRKIRDLGFLIKLDTNGNRPQVLRRLLDEGLLDYVAMDFKTCPDQYAGLVGNCVKVDSILESVAVLFSAGIEYEFRCTLIKEHHNEEVLTEMAAVLCGAERLYLQKFRNGQTLDPKFAAFNAFDDAEMSAIANFFNDSVKFVACR